jgi:selT/selW/selH-like putative selenoprotein
MIPSGGGCFELKVGGKLLYSKLATGKFPDEAEMLRLVAEALGEK